MIFTELEKIVILFIYFYTKELEIYSDETSDGSAVSDSQPAENQQDFEEAENSLQHEHDNNGKNTYYLILIIMN